MAFIVRHWSRVARYGALLVGVAACQSAGAYDLVPPIAPPAHPLPSEAATAGVTKFSFIAYGDVRGRQDGTGPQVEHGEVVRSMLDTIAASRQRGDSIRFILQTGDAVNDGSQYRHLTVSYIPLLNQLTQEGDIPYFMSIGNHDVGNRASTADPSYRAGMRNFFAANARLLPADGSPRRLQGYATYAFGYGNTFFIAFDSNIADDDAQWRWVRDQLQGLDRSRYVHIVVFFHHPPFSSGPHGGRTLEPPSAVIRDRWMPLFREHHVRVLIAGHEHLYEHWVERYTDGRGPHRMDEIVSGGGGAPLYVYSEEPDLAGYERRAKARLEHVAKPSPKRELNPYHYVVIHVDGARLRLEVIGVGWGEGFAPYPSISVDLSDPPQ